MFKIISLELSPHDRGKPGTQGSSCFPSLQSVPGLISGSLWKGIIQTETRKTYTRSKKNSRKFPRVCYVHQCPLSGRPPHSPDPPRNGAGIPMRESFFTEEVPSDCNSVLLFGLPLIWALSMPVYLKLPPSLKLVTQHFSILKPFRIC